MQPDGSQEIPRPQPLDALPKMNMFTEAAKEAFMGNQAALDKLPEVIRDRVLSNLEAFRASEDLAGKTMAAQILEDPSKILDVLHEAGFHDDTQINSVLNDLLASSSPVDREDDSSLGDHLVTREPSNPSLTDEERVEQARTDQEAMNIARDLQEVANDFQESDVAHTDPKKEAENLEKLDKVKKSFFDNDAYKKLMKSTLKVGGIGIGLFILLNILLLMFITGGGKRR